MRRVGGLQEAELLDMLTLRGGGTGLVPSVQLDSSKGDISARIDWKSVLIPLKFFLFHLSSLKFIMRTLKFVKCSYSRHFFIIA